MRRPKPHPTPRPRAPTPLSMRKHTGTHTCDVWSKRTGDGGLEETLANKTIKPPAPLRHCQWQKKSPTTQRTRAQAHAFPCNNPHEAENIQTSQSLGSGLIR